MKLKIKESEAKLIKEKKTYRLNKETIEAMKEANKIMKGTLSSPTYSTPEEMWRDICGE